LLTPRWASRGSTSDHHATATARHLDVPLFDIACHIGVTRALTLAGMDEVVGKLKASVSSRPLE
jgi:hypothetical protein